MRRRLFENGRVKKMKIAVIGGNGYLGSHVTKYFEAEALSRRSFEPFDVTSQEHCERLKDYDVIIHMGALVDKSDECPASVFRVNADGTRNVAQALRKGQVLIFTSTKEVYTPNDAYAYSKRIAEGYVQFYGKHKGFRYGIFQLSTTYALPCGGSSWVNYFVDCVKNGKEISLVGEGKQVRDFLYVDDLSIAFNLFINSYHEGIYRIGGGPENSSSIIGLVRKIEKVLDKKAVITFSDAPVTGQREYITHMTNTMMTLDWSPTFSLEEGLKLICQ